jgi:hypothetical protein
LQDAPQPRPELHDQRLVQPELLADGRERLRVDLAAAVVAAEDQQGDVTGRVGTISSRRFRM